MHTNKQSISVVGAGYWGKNLVRNFYELGSLHSLCDINIQVLNGFSSQYKDINVTSDFNSIIENPAIKGVAIALPAEAHYKFAYQALKAGKHVYVEKPLTIKISEAEELVHIAKDKNLVLMVGHLLQYHPVFRRLKEIVNSGDLGKIFYIYSNRLSLGKVRGEENVLWSFAPHDISMILSLCGKEPVDVFATGGYYLQEKISDITVINLIFPDGINSHIFVSWLNPFKEQKLVVIGEKKMAVFCDTEDWENKLLIYPYSVKNENNIPVPNKANPEKVNVQESEPLKNECIHFLNCIEKNIQPITNGEEGLRVLKVLRMAQESLNRRVK